MSRPRVNRGGTSGPFIGVARWAAFYRDHESDEWEWRDQTGAAENHRSPLKT
ncbi:MAG: hypothetical protein WAL64_04540 [Candidatus Dormiibacterota bacterium]